MAEKVRLTDEQKAQNNENIEKIKVLTEQIKAIVPNLNGKACKEAYENSVSNLETKNEKYVTKESFPIADEEKEIIRKYREGLITIKEKKV
jgi:hypothetical protein